VTSAEIAAAMIDALNASGISYLLAGSLSSNFYGIPRSTLDADFVIHLGNQPLSCLLTHLPAEFKLDLQMQFEGITGTYKNVVTVEESDFSVELFRLSQDAHDQERFRRRVEVALLQRRTFLPTAEDVIVTKLRWCRNKDRDDIRDVIVVQRDAVDWNYVHRWCDQHGTRALLEEILASIPPGI